jgi:hypothetical protein
MENEIDSELNDCASITSFGLGDRFVLGIGPAIPASDTWNPKITVAFRDGSAMGATTVAFIYYTTLLPYYR